MGFLDDIPEIGNRHQGRTRPQRIVEKLPVIPPEPNSLPTVIYCATACPECGGHKTAVYCTKPANRGIIIRYHKCLNLKCNGLFKSVEQR